MHLHVFGEWTFIMTSKEQVLQYSTQPSTDTESIEL
jgi:hypothetical protein